MNETEELLEKYKKYSQFRQYWVDNLILVRAKKNIGRPGETWLKRGDLSLVTGRLSPPEPCDKKFRISVFAWRENILKHIIGDASCPYDSLDFLDKVYETKFNTLIFNYLAEKEKLC